MQQVIVVQAYLVAYLLVQREYGLRELCQMIAHYTGLDYGVRVFLAVELLVLELFTVDIQSLCQLVEQ
jgi:hypothetical protein